MPSPEERTRRAPIDDAEVRARTLCHAHGGHIGCPHCDAIAEVIRAAVAEAEVAVLKRLDLQDGDARKMIEEIRAVLGERSIKKFDALCYALRYWRETARCRNGDAAWREVKAEARREERDRIIDILRPEHPDAIATIRTRGEAR